MHLAVLLDLHLRPVAVWVVEAYLADMLALEALLLSLLQTSVIQAMCT
jgi:hypothetical protein